MGMRIIWGILDTNFDEFICFFEAENLLVDYRDQLYRKWYEELTAPIPDDDLALTSDEQDEINKARANRLALLDMGRERWTIDRANDPYPRYVTKKYEIWNSVPPNPERLVMHFDS